MRYIFKEHETIKGFTQVFDTERKETYLRNTDLFGIHNDKKALLAKTTTNSLNLHHELSNNPQRKTKQQLLEIIKKYTL